MTIKDKRREIRLAREEDNLIVEASSLIGVSVSDFLLERAIADAEEIVRVHHTVSLPSDAHAKFMAALDAETNVNEALRAQARKARSLKSDLR